MEKESSIVQRIPLKTEGYCAPASMQSSLLFLGHRTTQEELSRQVKDKTWGTEPVEMENMTELYLDRNNILAKEGWSVDELEEFLRDEKTVAILDVTDKLKRICRIENEEVGNVDGHYITVISFINIVDKKFAVVIDPSDHDIVVEGKMGVKLSDCNNIYYLPVESLEEMWQDTNKDNTLNNHWALVMSGQKILEKYRVK